MKQSKKGPMRFFLVALAVLACLSTFLSLINPQNATTIRAKLEEIGEVLSQVNLAALYSAATEPDMKYIAVMPGMRKEEMAERFGARLDWTPEEIQTFGSMLGCYEENEEGYLFPGGYTVPETSTPDDVKQIMLERFEGITREELEQKIEESKIDLDKILIIASIIEREAAGKADRALISGIISNRLINDMTLDIDATLQYAKGEIGNWWPPVRSEDKYIESPYNTYQNKGLPPAPISNPSLPSIIAALTPQKTECIFYLHDPQGNIHCARTYTEHKRNVNIYLK